MTTKPDWCKTRQQQIEDLHLTDAEISSLYNKMLSRQLNKVGERFAQVFKQLKDKYGE